MKQKLTQEEFAQVVAEVQQLSLERESELEIEQVRDILSELNLSPEYLEEAMLRLQQRQTLRKQKRKNLWIAIGIVGATAFFILGIKLFQQNQQQTLGQIIVESDRITYTQDDGGNLNLVSRNDNHQLVYRVTLANAPVGQKLSLSCHWLNPNQEIVHQNNYQTKEITTPVWNTFCRYTIGSTAPVGTWKVQAFLGDRMLSDTNFEVK
jgi:hypothetical protein